MKEQSLQGLCATRPEPPHWLALDYVSLEMPVMRSAIEAQPSLTMMLSISGAFT
jgi:hypothetical protein